MKRGPRKKLKKIAKNPRQENKLEISPYTYHHLPSELIAMILSYVPAIQFHGKNKLPLVCKHWRGVIANNIHLPKKTSKEIIASCKQSLECALYALSDEQIFSKLSLRDMCNIASYHPVIACKLMLRKNCQYLPPDCIVALGKTHLEIANEINKNRDLMGGIGPGWNVGKIRSNHIAYHDDWVRELRASPEKRAKYPLETLAAWDIDFAHEIMSKKEIVNTLNGSQLVILGRHHSEIAFQIISSVELLKKLSPWELAQLARRSFKTAQMVLKMDIINEFSGQELAELGRTHVEIAKKILSNENFRKRLREQHAEERPGSIFDIGNFNWSFMWKLCEKHFEIAKELIKKYGAQMGPNDFYTLGIKYPSLAHEMLNNKQLQFDEKRRGVEQRKELELAYSLGLMIKDVAIEIEREKVLPPLKKSYQ
ncbi:MAG: F-box protein [Gammaproteobacteria bacterium]|jgi:hypothetical protein|nr:F-box protein [Gammaproteobacteria bacterium]